MMPATMTEQPAPYRVAAAVAAHGPGDRRGAAAMSEAEETLGARIRRLREA
jgi:hypothetical protein